LGRSAGHPDGPDLERCEDSGRRAAGTSRHVADVAHGEVEIRLVQAGDDMVTPLDLAAPSDLSFPASSGESITRGAAVRAESAGVTRSARSSRVMTLTVGPRSAPRLCHSPLQAGNP